MYRQFTLARLTLAGQQDQCLSLGLLLGTLDDEDGAFAILRAVAADAPQERPENAC
jgi:hypothetical protein